MIELAPADAKECRLKLSCGGFSREIPVHIGKEIALSRTPSKPIVLKTKDGSRILGTYRCAVENGCFLIDVEAFEQESLIRERPWEGSCLEVFLAGEKKEKKQFCIRHDGTVFQVANGIVEECPSIKVVPGERDGKTVRFRAEIPLSLMKDYSPEDKEFLFDFQQTVNTESGILRNILSEGVGCAVSAFAKAVVK